MGDSFKVCRNVGLRQDQSVRMICGGWNPPVLLLSLCFLLSLLGDHSKVLVKSLGSVSVVNSRIRNMKGRQITSHIPSTLKDIPDLKYMKVY